MCGLQCHFYVLCGVRIARLEAGEGDDFAFMEWQARMQQLDHERERTEFERRRLAGLLSQQKSIIARQKIVQHNKDLAADMKAEVHCHWLSFCYFV